MRRKLKAKMRWTMKSGPSHQRHSRQHAECGFLMRTLQSQFFCPLDAAPVGVDLGAFSSLKHPNRCLMPTTPLKTVIVSRFRHCSGDNQTGWTCKAARSGEHQVACLMRGRLSCA
jgi:hypothetical protein